MTDAPSKGLPPVAEHPTAVRLDSWKEIAAYLRRDVTTVQRWEKREGMPVHRHQHDKMGSVYALATELDAWAKSRSLGTGPTEPGKLAESLSTDDRAALEAGPEASRAPSERPPSAMLALRRRRRRWLLAATVLVLAAAVSTWFFRRHAALADNPLAGARFQRLTNFDGIEQAAAISRDGRFVAFQSDRDGPLDVWVSQVGTGQFLNLTRGAAPELFNPSVRTLDFSPDGTLVTFWQRGARSSGQPEINVWAVPLLGGAPHPYLEGVAEHDWSRDGTRLVFHTPGPGDPMFVREPASGGPDRRIFSAPAGVHGHFLLWAPDQAFIYFVQGTLNERMDIWRIRPTGGDPERVTHHDAPVSYPVFLDARTLLYLVVDPDGSGPWIYAIDVDRPDPHQVSAGVDTFSSLAASADGRRVVATLTSPKSTLWTVPMNGTRAEMSGARKVPLSTYGGTMPRLGPGFLLYVSSKGTTDGLWKLQAGTATELWSAPGARIIGAPAIHPDGRRIAFAAQEGGRTNLYVVNADGTQLRLVTGELQLRGTPAWAPDGQSITVAALAEGTPRLFKIPATGGPASPLISEHSVDPAWSPDGQMLVFTGPDVGTTFSVKAVKPDGSSFPLPALTLTRGARHLRFLPEGRSVALLRGEMRHKNLSVIDLETGAERRMIDLPPQFDVRDFDVSSDGRELVLEQLQEHADIVLIELPRR